MSAGRVGPFLQPRAVLHRRRHLPIEGEVLLGVGDRVDGDTVVARMRTRGRLHAVNAAAMLDMRPTELSAAMVCREGDVVVEGQVLARGRGLFGLFAGECRSPVAGRLVAVSSHTGRVLLEEEGSTLDLRAFLPGIVTERVEGRGVTVAGWAARVAGVFGIGGEGAGRLTAAVGRADGVLEAAAIDADHAGRVLLGGALVGAEALRRAAAVGVRGIITGGVHDVGLSAWLGEDIVLADTTVLPAPLTLVVTGGFGRVPMEDATFRLLRAHEGATACISGHTRVRAGAQRPEVFVPLVDRDPHDQAVEAPPMLATGSVVLVVRAPWFGRRGHVGALPPDPVRVESGARCPVAHVDLDDGRTIVVPRANLEVLAGPARQRGADR